jgi:CheY-like chemotaxis protein
MASILIVDDDRDGRDALCQFLQRSGYQVECVSDGRDALAAGANNGGANNGANNGDVSICCCHY